MCQDSDEDLQLLIKTLPPSIASKLSELEESSQLLEVVLDLGRKPEARFLSQTLNISSEEVTVKDIKHVATQVGHFESNNRAGIERTLHRISAIRNRNGEIIGLTLRVGRAIFGTINLIKDLIFTGKSILLLGKPGVGKTTMLRQVARILADDSKKRVVIVDTSNEIGGDGDIPHYGIGNARRMQVSSPSKQHSIMIEAVENHMPEVIVIDEIGTELEADAARTIAERGVQLVATAHGNTLENLIVNPTLSDLIGGIETVTLGDDEARRRRSRKTVLERKSPPTFDILIELKSWDEVFIHSDVSNVVDLILHGSQIHPECRKIDANGVVINSQSQRDLPHISDRNGNNRFDSQPETFSGLHRIEPDRAPETQNKILNILPYGVNKGKLQNAVTTSRIPIEIVSEIDHADILLTTKNFYKRRTLALRQAEEKGKPVYVLRKNTTLQIQQFLKAISNHRSKGQTKKSFSEAINEAEKATRLIEQDNPQVKLSPQGAYVRRIQHQIAEKSGLSSFSSGKEPSRHVILYRH